MIIPLPSYGRQYMWVMEMGQGQGKPGVLVLEDERTLNWMSLRILYIISASLVPKQQLP